MPSLKKIWEIIKSCIAAFLIKQSFHKLNKNRISNYESNSNIREPINKNEYIELDYNIFNVKAKQFQKIFVQL